MNKRKKSSIARALKGMFAYINKHVSAGERSFNVRINDQQYDDIDIVNMIETFARTSLDRAEPTLDIIDVSDRAPEGITRPPIKRQAKPVNWLSHVPSEIFHHYRSAQIEIETKRFYEVICQTLADALVKRGQSLQHMIKRYDIEFYGPNSYRLLYDIAIYHVDAYYRYQRHDVNDERLKPFVYRLGAGVKRPLQSAVARAITEIAPIDDDTRVALKLTRYLTPVVWWDESGDYRAEHTLTKNQQIIMSFTTKRTTLLWSLPVLANHVIKLYLTCYNVIIDQLSTAELSNRQTTSALLWLLKNNQQSSEYYLQKHTYGTSKMLNCSAPLMRIVESYLRAALPSAKMRDISKIQAQLSAIYPEPICQAIYQTCQRYIDALDEDKKVQIGESILVARPEDWRQISAFLLTQTEARQLDYLYQLATNAYLDKLAKSLLDRTKNNALQLTCLFIMARHQALRKKDEKLLEALLYSDNVQRFNALVHGDNKIDKALTTSLLKLTQPVRRAVTLNAERLQSSSQAFIQTVAHVEQFIDIDRDNGDDEQVAPIDTDSRASTHRVEHHNRWQLLAHFSQDERVAIATAEQYASDEGQLLAAYIDAINQDLYVHFDDQVLTLTANAVVVDPFYHDQLKELIADETNRQSQTGR